MAISESEMSKFKSDFLRVLDERGFIHQVSDPEALDTAARSGRITAYVGYDATATSLHIGNLISATMLYWLQETGHRPIALMGGGTSMIGDPSFRDEQRGLLTPEAITTNIEGIKKIFGRILKFGDGPTEAVMVNNADWLLKLNYVEFLRDVGRHFSVNRMLTFDSVKLRLDREQSLSFLEFNYMILQGYDFVELNRRYGCVLQMGGSDQWGNIVNGIDLGHKMGTPQLHALTTPLLTTPCPASRSTAHCSQVVSVSCRCSSPPGWHRRTAKRAATCRAARSASTISPYPTTAESSILPTSHRTAS
jgi:tyrosyl-tRNA synthetase